MAEVSEEIMATVTSQLTYNDIMEILGEVMDQGVVPNIKIEPGDEISVAFEGINRIISELSSSGRGVRMRPRLIKSMLKSEANLPSGMTLTRKVPGGSPTASVKREFGIQTRLSKKKTAETFADMYFVAEVMFMNRFDEYEVAEYMRTSTYDEDNFEGIYYYLEVPSFEE